MTATVETFELTRRFGRARAVDRLNLAVPQGSVYALLGSNGAGKTTTIKMLMNLIRPSAGRASVLGVESTRLGPRELSRIGYVSENQELPEWMNVRQLMRFLKPLYEDWDDELAARLVAQFGLPWDQRLRAFSRGMKMKAAMVAALAYRPRLLILDEPFSGLDPLVRDEIVEGMLELDGDRTVLVSSHDLSEVEYLADHVGFIRDGALSVSAPLSELQERFREVEVTLPSPAVEPPVGHNGWLRPRASGNVVRFVDSEHDGATLARLLDEIFPGHKHFSATPMSLRDIFVAMAGRQGAVR